MIRVVVLIALASADLGADRRLDRAAAVGRQRGAAGRPVPGRLPGQRAVPVAVVGIVRLASQPEHLAQPADGARHAVVHPVQRHRRRQRLPDRPARSRDAFTACAPGNGGARSSCPGILPYYVTGALTASGGSWNASIVAEVASWGDTKLEAAGLGAYIAKATDAGDFRRVVLGIAVMSVFVVAVQPRCCGGRSTACRARFRLD